MAYSPYWQQVLEAAANLQLSSAMISQEYKQNTQLHMSNYDINTKGFLCILTAVILCTLFVKRETCFQFA